MIQEDPMSLYKHNVSLPPISQILGSTPVSSQTRIHSFMSEPFKSHQPLPVLIPHDSLGTAQYINPPIGYAPHSPLELMTPFMKPAIPSMPSLSEVRKIDSSPVATHPSTAPSSSHILVDVAESKNTRKYKCKTCEKCFTTSGHLARHTRIHTGERKHECPFAGCEARFARQDNCMQHFRTHKNSKNKRRRSKK